jgi:hypothetical protein
MKRSELLKFSGALCLAMSMVFGATACGGQQEPALDSSGDTFVLPDITHTDLTADLTADSKIDAPNDADINDLTQQDSAPLDTADVHFADADSTDPDAAEMPSVWGWISVIEWNDTCDQWYQKTQWFGGVRAYFADEANYNRALPHTLDWCTPKTTVGSCTLYDPMIMDEQCINDLAGCQCLDKGVECDDTGGARWCPEDQVCVEIHDGEPYNRGTCVDLPPHHSAGDITLGGLKTPITMQPDEMDRYIQKILPDPNDLFDQGDVITATTTGGDLPPLSFSAKGVAPLVISNQVLEIRLDTEQPSTVRWTPADPQSRIQVALMGGSHDPNPLAAAIICDVPDSDGKVEVAASLLQELRRLSCNGNWMMKCSRITRYTRDVKQMGTKQVELFVGSARNLQMMFQ